MTLLRKSYYTLILTFFSICALAIAQPPLVYGIDFMKGMPDTKSEIIIMERPPCSAIELTGGLGDIQHSMDQVSEHLNNLRAHRNTLRRYLNHPHCDGSEGLGHKEQIVRGDVDDNECKERFRRSAETRSWEVTKAARLLNSEVLTIDTRVAEVRERCNISKASVGLRN